MTSINITERPSADQLKADGWTVYTRIKCSCKTTYKDCKHLHYRKLNDFEMYFCKQGLTVFAQRKIN